MGEVLPQGNPPKSLRGQPRTPVRLLAHEKAQCWNQCPRQRHMKRFVKCFFELLTQIIVKVRKCKVQRVCVLHFQLAGSGGCFFLMKLYH